MEKSSKSDLPLSNQLHSSSGPTRKKAYITIDIRTKHLLVLLGLALIWIGTRFSGLSYKNVLARFRPLSSSTIAWSSCADLTEYECAYLSVPLDYTNPLPNETVSLALRRLPATAPKKDRMGTLFINPGGPGGSGTAAVVQFGTSLSVILKGRYDILSWDPRGVNMTTPPLDCYPTAWDQAMQELKQSELGLPFEHAAHSQSQSDLSWYEKTDAYFRSTVASCGRNGNQKMLESLSTAFVARDMVRILEGLGEEKKGLQYWGFSYGTILGATFSAMFPELVHRVVLDGVSSSVYYTQDLFEWGRSGMDDTHKTYDGFLSECARAGPAGCALAKANGTSSDVLQRINALVDTLLIKPLSVPFGGRTSGILTASDVQQAIFRALYAPRAWPGLAKVLVEAEKGDGIALLDLVHKPEITDRTDPIDNIFKRYMTKSNGPLSTEAIMCSDTEPSVIRTSPSATTFRDYTHELAKMSVTGEAWATWIGRCRWWNITARETYRGPWTVEEGLKKTKFPVMFLGNTADPVTPLSAAKDMSLGFGNGSATLLVQNGYGHCSVSHPSLCTAKTVAKYFFEGVVPEYGTLCESDDGFLFPTAQQEAERLKAFDEEEREVMLAMERLSESMYSMQFF